MPLKPTDAALLLAGRVAERLNARLQHNVSSPVALALSGGGDSMALLEIATGWARFAGRQIVAITVDHGLSPASRGWSRACAAAARTAGADWIERRWEGEKPLTGLPAAARRARHVLIAEAAREVGAKVILFGHTADDTAESDWMRVNGSNLGHLREWSPSPVWPEGRGLMLMRPLLGERREALRDLLRTSGRDWIEDPANAGFARGEARRALGGSAGETDLSRGPRPGRPLPGHVTPLSLGEGFEGGGGLGVTLICAAGHDRLPRSDRLNGLAIRLAQGDPFAAVLAGARVQRSGKQVVITREAGELRRRPLPPLALTAGEPAVWDGRYEITVDDAGWRVVPALGLLARLTDRDRAIVARSPAAARGTLPVLIREGSTAPVLAWRRARVFSLAPRRLSLASGETTQESDLNRTIHGETPPPDLF
ncbi:tRNA lysidine(34) synthetase TilS [Brevundimonas sp. R86498]|uniref:tRNA lysidine(34) synthetase TilS n=1 Tax=Brevundimonas sp. R86498 TaxID=3093845 RepID=UPI0037C6CC82